MDGRLFRKWFLCGCLLAAAVGCNHKAKQQTLIGPMDADAAKYVNMPVPGPSKSFSFWGRSHTPTVPVEVAPEVSKKAASASAIAALADVQVQAAFDSHTAPGSKEPLLDSARKRYQKALQQEPKNKPALLGMARYYAQLNERQQSVEWYKKYLTYYPTDANTAHEVAIAHARWKDWRGAVDWCRFTLQIDPENRDVKKTLGFCEAWLGDWDAALNTLCQIMDEAKARHNLAGLLRHMGYTDACKQQEELALRADPNYAPSAAILAELNQADNPNAIQTVGAVEPEQ